MSNIPLASVLPGVSSMAYGCMGLGGGWDKTPVDRSHVNQTRAVLDAALEVGINLFDHADIYTFGKAETAFGRALKEQPELRDKIYIQSKCGIRFDDELGPGRYDFSSSWVNTSVDGILERLQCDYIDVLLLHRPDPLMEPEELSTTLTELRDSGKVKHFGVSNMQRHQLEFLQSFLDFPLVINQLEVSLHRHDWLDEGVLAGNSAGKDTNFTPGTLEYCRREGVQLQSWGSLCQGLYSGRDVSSEAETVQRTADRVRQLSELYSVSPESVVLGWLMRHPAAIQPVLGSTNIDRIRACGAAPTLQMSREHWYSLYVSARGQRLP